MQKQNCYHNTRRILLLLILLIGIEGGFSSCINVQDEYCRRPCYIVIDNSIHLDATLASAMNPSAPGVFCLIKETQQGGARYFSFTTNQGLDSKSIVTAVDDRITRIVGLNNGVIVGFGNLDNPAVFYAYDNECPNCFDPDAIPVKSKPLAMDNIGHASCRVCGRVYDMNNRGLIIKGNNGEPLNRFPANTGGPYSTLIVQ